MWCVLKIAKLTCITTVLWKESSPNCRYLSYSDTHLYIGFHAFSKPENIRASVRSRDDLGMISDDFVVIAFDTYGDSRNNYLLLSNAFGSQLDARAINALTDEDRYDINFNVDHETSGTIVSDGYQVEFKIPFASLPFPNGNNQEWNFNFKRSFYQLQHICTNRSKKSSR